MTDKDTKAEPTDFSVSVMDDRYFESSLPPLVAAQRIKRPVKAKDAPKG
jgi:hypothetical protein